MPSTARCSGTVRTVFPAHLRTRTLEVPLALTTERPRRATALVYVNTLMIQDILAQPEWDGVLTPEDLRGLTPLFWAHVLPYGEVNLNMTKRLALNSAQTVETSPEAS